MVDIKLNWNLEKYYYSGFEDEKFIGDINKIKNLVDKFIIKYKNKIKTLDKNQEILDFLNSENEIESLMNHVAFYVYYRYYLNSESEEVQKKIPEIENLFHEISEKLIFVEEEIKKIGENKLIEFSNREELSNYKNYFYQIAINLKYQLEDRVERALHLKSKVQNQLKLYEDLASSYTFNFKGEELREDELIAKLKDEDEEIRKKAFLTFREFYLNKERRITHASIYNSVLKARESEIKLRGFKSAISMQNLAEELSDNSVDLLLNTVEENYNLYSRYLKLKAKKLKKEKLNQWDLYAPIKKINKEFNIENSINLVLETLKDFDLEAYNFAKDMIESGRVDFNPKIGKEGGAFANYEKGEPSFVLLNHVNDISDVSTLAHELGHAYHGFKSQIQEHQGFSSAMSLAETASVFNELLLSEKFKEILNDEDYENYLFENLDGNFRTIHRQVMYVLFERRVHDGTLKGETYTQNDFSKIWREESKKSYGDSIEFYGEENEEINWQIIPHIYRSPFYCYSYAFGQILSFSLYEKYLEEGNSFIDKYKRILSLGGSKTPAQILQEVGIDIEKKEFYENGIKVLEKKVEELEKLIL